MQPTNPPQKYEVAAGEVITVEIEKSLGQWLVSVTALDNATWDPKLDAGVVGVFTAPQAVGDIASFTAFYNFTPGGPSAGDFYKTTMKGETGDGVPSYLAAPGFQYRTYYFRVA